MVKLLDGRSDAEWLVLSMHLQQNKQLSTCLIEITEEEKFWNFSVKNDEWKIILH